MSEIVDSGNHNHNHNHNIPLEKSNFSHTFNLLNQYLKENGTLGDLTLGLASSPTATMNLFPAAMKSASPVPKKQPESAQLTIFYAGEVIVVDDFPADKAMKIMMLAGKGTSHTFPPASDWIPKTQPCNLLPSTHINTDKEGIQLLRSHPGVSDLPIARKASLARFLEKRKERITARGPYQGEKHSPSKESWVGSAAGEYGVQFEAQS